MAGPRRDARSEKGPHEAAPCRWSAVFVRPLIGPALVGALLAGGGALLVLLVIRVVLLALLARLRALLPLLARLRALLVLLARLGALLALLAALLVGFLVHRLSSSVPRNCDTRSTGPSGKSLKLNAGQWPPARNMLLPF